ncbi:MAG: DUF3604 domain-containing protein, partial [Pseudomonadales bacterium]|nr:DUF3604 domain-containing protein [Pseudomonadales bacterium]
VPDLPISFLQADTAEKLWESLDEQCVNTDKGCDVIVIPHNSNLSDSQMFLHTKDDGSPIDKAYAERIQRFERLVEVMQHKGSSECFFGPGAMEDELCDFEQLPYDKFSGKFSSFLRKKPEANDGFLRQVMNEGLQEQELTGVNPFKWGFIASTDTHLGAPGAVDERNFPGHGGAGEPATGAVPKGLPDDLEFNPGGLAVLWAEENSRESLFSAMRRREAYGTSGPRITVRFFGGWDMPDSLCSQSDLVETGYRQGVPMGSDLPRAGGTTEKPVFVVSALKDAGTAETRGMDLQRIQIIKGWLDSSGTGHQKVFEVAGDPDNGASVDINTCRTQGQGFSQLCSVWHDKEFDPGQSAWYYARVVENPTCRWSQQICAANNVDCAVPSSIKEGLEACCSDSHRPVIQERAWTSPIWYTPASSSP